MSDYRAPVKDMRFVMDELAGFKELSQLPGYEDATPDLADAILEEAAKFAGEVLAPLNRIGDKEGCKLTPNGVTTPAGWKEAYKQFCEPAGTAFPRPPILAARACPIRSASPSRKWSARPIFPSRSARCSPPALSKR
jgi:hypothetical protein